MVDTNTNDVQIDSLEKMGVEQVRLHVMTSGFPTAAQLTAVKWLAGKDQEERRRNEASHLEQSDMTRSAKKAAWTAAIAAIVAAIVAIMGAVISCLAWLWPHP